MTLRKRASSKTQEFSFPLSYRLNERNARYTRAKNISSIQKRTVTRHGTSRFNEEPLEAEILSCSHFVDNDGNDIKIVKAGTKIFKVNKENAHTVLKSGLSATTKHFGKTFRNRHIIVVEEDGYFQYDGTTFTILGQDPPITPTVALGLGAGNLSDATWKIKLTYYASTTGFETNASNESASITTTAPNSRVVVSAIPTNPLNATIDKVRIYASKDGGSFFFVDEINLGTTTYNVDDDPDSAQTPPTTHAPPPAGGAKYLTIWNEKMVFAGNANFLNDIIVGESNLPDAVDDTGNGLRLFAKGDGVVTGLGVGLYNDSALDPYLVYTKRKNISIYSEIGQLGREDIIEKTIGCVNNNTIIQRNGNVYFMSDSGWRMIKNGQLVKDSKDEISLGLGDIDEIFKNQDFELALTRTQLENSFSAYYGELDQYMTFVADKGATTFENAYVYEFLLPGFKYYEFPIQPTCAMSGQDSNGDEEVYICAGRYIYKHSIREERSDVNDNNQTVPIDVLGRLIWLDGKDIATTYWFRDLIIRALNSENELNIYAYADYDESLVSEEDFDFSVDGFRLDVSRLDIDRFGDARQIVTLSGDINRVAQTLAIEFRQNVIDGNVGLLELQLDYNKNGNLNR